MAIKKQATKKKAAKTGSKKKVSARRLWSKSDDAQLKRMAKAGSSTEAIAKALNRSVHAIYLRGSDKKVRFSSRSLARKK